MTQHIDPNDPRYRNAAAEILRRHDSGEQERLLTLDGVKDFVVVVVSATEDSHQPRTPSPVLDDEPLPFCAAPGAASWSTPGNRSRAWAYLQALGVNGGLTLSA